MKQQVNLYQPMFRKQRRVFSALAMVQSALLVAIGLLAIFGYGEWQLRELAREVASLERDRDAAAARIATLRSEIPGREPSKVLAAEIARLQRSLTERRGLAETLSRDIGSRRGFSGLLAGLARGHVDGVWITGLRSSRDPVAFEVRGSASAPELVPRLVRGLAAEKEFSGQRFRALTIERPEIDPPRVDFTLLGVGARGAAPAEPAR